MDWYGDRLLEETYAADEIVGACLLSEVAKDANAYRLWIPERLFARIQLLVKAYELHLLPVLDPNGRNVLTHPQAESLLDELNFIASVVGDEMLATHIQRLGEVAEQCVRSPREERLVIEGP